MHGIITALRLLIYQRVIWEIRLIEQLLQDYIFIFIRHNGSKKT